MLLAQPVPLVPRGIVGGGWLARVSAALSAVPLAALVVATVTIHQPVPMDNARSIEVSRATVDGGH
jgi:hypothetical protein